MKFVNLLLVLLGLVSSVIAEQECETNENGVCINTDAPSQVPRQQSKEKVAVGANEHGLPPTAPKECVDRYPQCQTYYKQDQCQENPGWMIVNCPASCSACHLRDPKVRCNKQFLNISSEPIYKPGDMNDMFSHLVENFGDRYDVTVLSSDPWVVRFDNFLTDEEIAAILESVEGNWERSTDTGKTNEFGETGRTLSQSRTSNNAWCRSKCENNPLVQRVIHKIEEVTRVPKDNYESFQILRYEIGQYYRTHHDMGERQISLSCGPRILTFFMYLSDVEEGGETNFPLINLAVKPKKGSAVLWPSVFNDDLLKQDARTHHEAKAVTKGLKYGANSWIHLYDFEKSNLWGCTGTFDYI